jgi:hypothetical protein
VEETGVSGENHRPVANHGQTLSHNVVLNTPRHKGTLTHSINGDKHLLHRELEIQLLYRYSFYFYSIGWSWSYGSWTYNYLYNQCLLLLKLWVRTPLKRGVLDTTLCDKVCQWLVTSRWFSQGSLGFIHHSNWPPQYNWNIVESGVKHHKLYSIGILQYESITI